MPVSQITSCVTVLVAALALGSPAMLRAAEPPVAAESSARTDHRGLGWLTAVTPRRHMFELGAFGGLFLPSRALELHHRNLPFVRYQRVSSELGLRIGYFPIRHFGFEGELAMMPTRVETEQRAFVSSVRAHAIGQLGISRLVPFVLLGGGVLSVRSEDSAAGRDADQALVLGGGVKLMLNPHIVLRLDVRDMLTPRRGIRVDAPANNVEVLLGFSLALGPRKKKEDDRPPDADGDGVIDAQDRCPQEAATTDDGCPKRDADEDGVTDEIDRCPNVAAPTADGCPLPDQDGDGVPDPEDVCVDQAGVAPDGCPIPEPTDEPGDSPPDEVDPGAPVETDATAEADAPPPSP